MITHLGGSITLTGIMPASFITLDRVNKIIQITPASISDLGDWTVSLTLTDTSGN